MGVSDLPVVDFQRINLGLFRRYPKSSAWRNSNLLFNLKIERKITIITKGKGKTNKIFTKGDTCYLFKTC